MSRKKRGNRKPPAAPAAPAMAPTTSAHPPDAMVRPPGARGRGLLAGGVAVLVLALAFFSLRSSPPGIVTTAWPAPAPYSATGPAFGDFVGAETCGECHREQYTAWSTSTHGRAGGDAGPDVLIAAFDRRPIRFADAVVIPFSVGGQYGFEVRQDGQLPATYTVDGVIGGGHMVGGGTQGFVSNFPDGTVRFLPFDFIRAEAVWFCNTNSRTNEGWVAIRPDMALAECGDWPPNRVLGSELRYANCEQCHGSQITIVYQPDSLRYVTRFQTLQINCESCHGPGRGHVEGARSGTLGADADIGILTFATVDKDSSLGVCFQCHALKGTIETGYLPGASMQEHYSLKLPLIQDEPFFPDGRVRTFAYQQNHVASDCYLNGSMTCTDCHDPHSSTYRDVFSQPLASRFADGQCLSCHPSKADVSAHTRHPAGSPGSQCVSCHMPYLQHPELGDSLRFARSDHSIPIPRPAFDAAMGVKNACVGCHAALPVDELERQSQEWFGALKPHKDIVSALVGRDTLARVDAAEQLLRPGENHPMAQAAALNRFIDEQLTPNMQALEPEAESRLRLLAGDRDIDIRSIALAALHFARGQDPNTRAFLGEVLRQLGPLDHDVRGRWAVVLGALADSYKVGGNSAAAVITYRKALEIRPDHPWVLLNLGIAYNDDGDRPNAIRFFQRLLQDHPDHALAWLNLGSAFEAQERSEEAAEAYRRAIAANPVEPLAHFNLGNYYLRRNEAEPAIAEYQLALRYDPGLGRAWYYLARAFVLANQGEPALRAARRAVELDPTNLNAPVVLEQLERALAGRGN